ncbi:MAG TPA: hypothetical protein VGE51_11070 [Fontimonas sp.]
MTKRPLMTLVALCIAGSFGAANAESRAQTRLMGEGGMVRSALSQSLSTSADREQRSVSRSEGMLRERVADRRESRENRLAERDDSGSRALAGLEDTENDDGARELTLGRLKVAVETDANRKGEDEDDQPAAASGKLTVSTIPKEGEDSDAKGSSLSTGLALKGPTQDGRDGPFDDSDDESRTVGGSAETSLKLSTPKRDDSSETNTYGGNLKVGLNGITPAPADERN